MAFFAMRLVLIGNLELILEFVSVTFLLVSLLMAYANYKIRLLTHSSSSLTILAMIGLLFGTLCIAYYEFNYQPKQLTFIIFLYLILTSGSWLYARKKLIPKN